MKISLPTRAAVLTVASFVAASTAEAQQESSIYRIDVRVAETDEKPQRGDARTSAASIFTRVPETVSLIGKDGVQLATHERSRGSSELSVATGGESICVRVFAKRADQASVPLQFAIVRRGTVDPCTGKVPVEPMLDWTTDSPEPESYTHTYWILVCDPGPCHWVKIVCTHTPGIP